MKTPGFIYTFPLITVAMLVAPAALAVQTDCNDKEAEYGWQKLLAKYPGDRDVRGLYQLRRSLCRQVESKSLSLDAASDRFEEARQRLISKWRRQNGHRKVPTSVTG